MTILNKIKMLLYSSFFIFNFIQSEPWKEFAEALDIVSSSQEKKIEEVSTQLEIDDTITTEGFIEKLKNYTNNIKTLIIRKNKIINFDNPNIPWNNLKNLKRLNLTGTDISDNGLKKIFENCPNLKTLDLSSCKKITQEGFKTLNWNKISNLKELDLSETDISDVNFTTLELTILDLSSCKKIAANEFENIVLLFLTELNLSDTKIGNKGLSTIVRLCDDLEKLDISFCEKISATKFEKLKWDEVKNLKELDLSWTNVTDKAVQKILAECSLLTMLDLENCTGISEPIRKKFNSQEEIQNLKKSLVKT